MELLSYLDIAADQVGLYSGSARRVDAAPVTRMSASRSEFAQERKLSGPTRETNSDTQL